MRRWFLLILMAAGISSAAAQAPAAASESDLVFAVILSRHGIRSPLLRNEEMAKFAADPWPVWEVSPGLLTPHGRRNMEFMGRYYRAYFAAQGLLSGRPEVDAPQIFFRADSNQRTIVTAQALAEGLVPGMPVTVHSLPQDQRGDPLLDPETNDSRADQQLREASIRGRLGGDGSNLAGEYRPALGALERVLLGGDGTPPAGKVSLLSLDPQRPLWSTAQRLVDAMVLEYADGKPLAAVGWGRLAPAQLTQLMTLSALGFDLNVGTFYIAQRGASDLASHLLATLTQAARGQPVEGALGAPGQRLVVLVGHDSNIVPLGRLLDLNWRLPGTPANPVLPGGAMIFELRRRHADGQLVVRTRYVSESLDQMRAGTPLTLEHPPGSAPIFVPDCSTAAPGYDAPLDRFSERLRAAIDPKLVVPEPSALR